MAMTFPWLPEDSFHIRFDTVNVRLKEVLEEASELRQLLAEKDLKVAQLEELHQRAFQQVTETQSLLDRERTSKVSECRMVSHQVHVPLT